MADLMHRVRWPVSIADLCRSAKRRDDRIPCLALLAVRGARTIELPNDDFEIQFGDRFLFAGQVAAENDQSLVLQNANVAAYVWEPEARQRDGCGGNLREPWRAKRVGLGSETRIGKLPGGVG